MSITTIKSMIEHLPESNGQKVLLKKLNHVDKEMKRTEARYFKANEDKLTLSHLLTKVNKELEESLSNEKRFIASVSHELRTPLTAILGYSELLDDTALNNKQKRYLHNIVQSSEHLLALISDLLDVAKLEDNRIELSLKEFDLDDLLNECATVIQSKIDHEVDFNIDIPLLDYPIISDNKRLKQIFLNLLSNAAKFTKKGSIHFYVKTLEELEDNKLQVIINVDDTGDGIPSEVEETLFQPFQSTDKTQGTGLGLYISQQLAYLMNGDISVESKSGIGTSFSVKIIVERAKKKEMGKELKGANVMMFAQKDEFVSKITKECMGYAVNFQNYCLENSDMTSALVQMVVSGRFYDIAVFDMDIFKNHTAHIAGTLKAINPEIKLIALISEDNERHYTEFDKIISKPIPYQRFMKEIESIYAENLFPEQESLDYSKLDILIVEDAELNREYEKEMLNNFFSISCDTAVNGKEAVEKAKAHQYDAILMDMRMPIMDGLDATRAIRQFDTKIPIICMSANVYKEDKMAAEESGMNDFIEKPLSKADIESKLVKLLNNEFISKEVEAIIPAPIERKPIVTEVIKIAPQKVKSISHNIAHTSMSTEIKAETASGLAMKTIAFKHLQNNFNEEISTRLYGKALESIEEYIKRVDSNFRAKNTKELLEDFHVIKGVCANIGLSTLANNAGKLQKIAESGNFLSLMRPKIQLLQSLTLLINAGK